MQTELKTTGRLLLYEGHDVPRNQTQTPKSVDQPMTTPNGLLTQNGKFYEAAMRFKDGLADPELVKVYEKIKDGIWVYNGIFELIDSWTENSERRKVFKFKLNITDKTIDQKLKRMSLLQKSPFMSFRTKWESFR